MKKYTQEMLENEGYEICNAVIKTVSLSMADHGCLTLDLTLNGDSWGCTYGGYCLGNGYLGAKDFKGSAKGIEAIMRIMDVVGKSDLLNLKGEYVRIAVKRPRTGNCVKIIGNIIKDQWFDYESFFNED